MKTYEYGLLAPSPSNIDIIYNEMRLANEFYNKLIEIERWRRQQVSDFFKKDVNLAPLYAKENELTNALTLVWINIKLAYAAQGNRDIPNQLAEQLNQIKSDFKKVYSEMKPHKEAHRNCLFFKTLNEEAKEKNNIANRESKCFWGTKAIAAAAAKQSIQTSKGMPRFQFRSRDVSLGIQDTGTGIDGNIEIIMPENPRKPTHRILRWRVRSENKKPIFVDFPMILHRPLPENSKIKTAMISCRFIGGRPIWKVHLAIDIPKEMSDAYIRGKGHVAIDVGWRLLPDGNLRIAAWRGSDGRTGEVILPPRDLEAFDKVNAMHGANDQDLNTFKEQLIPLIRELPFFDFNSIAKWKSPSRFLWLYRQWSKFRIVGDEKAYDLLEGWRYRFHHLNAYECGMHRTVRLRRRELYRLTARKLSREYEEVIIEETNWSELAKTPEDGDINRTARKNRMRASISEFTLALKNAFQLHRVGLVEARDTTKTCANCKHKNKKSDKLIITCVDCGIQYDRDHNAAQVQCERWSAAKQAGTARYMETLERKEEKHQAARAKRERMVQAKRDKIAARKAAANAA